MGGVKVRVLEVIEVEGQGVDWQSCAIDGLKSCDFAHKELLVSASACQQGPIASSLLPLMSRGLEHTLKSTNLDKQLHNLKTVL